MHSDIKRGAAMLESAAQFEISHPLPVPNARAAMLFGEIREAAMEIRTMAANQQTHRSWFLSGSAERRIVAESMRRLMRQIARVAKYLKPAEYPTVREKLQVPRSNGYVPLQIRADLFLETIGPIKAAFLERGMPADFDVRLQGLMTQFAAATKRKSTGLSGQVGNTAGMRARLREAVRAVRELDVIMSLLLEDDPATYAAWRSASHIERAPRRSDLSQTIGTESAMQPSVPQGVGSAKVDFANGPAGAAGPPLGTSPPGAANAGDDPQLGLW
jgi:hypothetical protein